MDLVLFLDATSAGYVIRIIPFYAFETNYIHRIKEYALFEPGCRHVAKDLMGTNKANPTAMILSATMMLRHLGYASPPLNLRNYACN